ncbi:MAG: prealbumin-like fold domain-containing protein, partial [bacterium]
ETAAPEGYELLTTSWNVVIDSPGETVNLGNISNTLITGSLTLRKITSTGTPLAGAEFTLYDANGAVVASRTTASDGTLSFTGIPYGSYVLKETKAPEGYELLTTSWNVVIDSQGKVVDLGDIINTPTPVPTPTPTPPAGETVTPPPTPPSPEVAGETATPPPTPTPEVAGETALPVTGVPISYLFGIGGILLILGGVLFLVLKKSKKEDF